MCKCDRKNTGNFMDYFGKARYGIRELQDKDFNWVRMQ